MDMPTVCLCVSVSASASLYVCICVCVPWLILWGTMVDVFIYLLLKSIQIISNGEGLNKKCCDVLRASSVCLFLLGTYDTMETMSCIVCSFFF